MAIEAGTRAGKYELMEQLGAGGFGLVFLARDHELGRDCALKVLRPEHTGNADHVQRFLQEARAAARIHHPGIVTVYECGQFPSTGSGVDGLVYIAMERLGGESLAARLRLGALTVASAVGIARQIAAAAGAAHRAGIVHRDLKPENVYLVPDAETVSGERVKVLDFGIAKLGDTGDTADDGPAQVHTAAYQILGSPRYMSPEQCRSTAQADARSDVYSLGVILFEMVSGERPFNDPDTGALIAAHQVTPAPRLRERVPGAPAELDALVGSMLAKSPDARPQSMDVVQRVLERTRTGGSAVDTSGATEHVPTSPSLPVHPSPTTAPASPPAGPRTLPAGGGPGAHAPTEQVGRRRSGVLPWVIGGVLAVGVGVTAIVLATRSSGDDRDGAPGATGKTPQAPSAASAGLVAPQELRDQHRATVARRDAAALGAGLAPDVFAVGPHAPELALGAGAARALIETHVDRIPIGPRAAPIGHAGDVAWWLEVGSDRKIASSTVAVAAGGAWRVAAWKLAYLVPNGVAAKLAAAGKLPVPAEPTRGAAPPPATPEAEMAFRAAMSSREGFVEAFSTRDDAIATGTAPGEQIPGGRAVRTTFARLKSEFALRGEVATGRVTDRAAWAVANIDYLQKGYTTQIFRVFALLLKEDERWTIALAHFSNAGPIARP